LDATASLVVMGLQSVSPSIGVTDTFRRIGMLPKMRPDAFREAKVHDIMIVEQLLAKKCKAVYLTLLSQTSNARHQPFSRPVLGEGRGGEG
jgi:hypothetical protein